MADRLAEEVRYRTIAQDDGRVLLQERHLIKRGETVVFEEPWQEDTVYADDPIDDLSPHQKRVVQSARKAAMVDLATRPPEDEVPVLDPAVLAPESRSDAEAPSADDAPAESAFADVHSLLRARGTEGHQPVRDVPEPPVTE